MSKRRVSERLDSEVFNLELTTADVIIQGEFKVRFELWSYFSQTIQKSRDGSS